MNESQRRGRRNGEFRRYETGQLGKTDVKRSGG